MEKILTVSIAAYNAERDLAYCLDSLVNSNVQNQLDIIVINDGSVDTTPMIAQSYVDRYPDSIRLINKNNGGHGSTINASIPIAQGKYYKLLDSDDWLKSESLDRLVEYLEENDVDMVLNPYQEVSFFNRTEKKFFDPNQAGVQSNVILSVNNLNTKTILYMHSLTFKTSIVKQMGSIIDENCFYVDMEYCVFPMLYVKTFSCLSYPVYQYLIGSQTQSMSMENLIKRRDQHLKVTKRLVNFYNKNAGKLPVAVKNSIALRIKYAVYQQYKIYLNMAPGKAYEEIKGFDTWLGKQNKELYAGPEGRQMKFIRFNRMTGYKLFVPFLALVFLAKSLCKKIRCLFIVQT